MVHDGRVVWLWHSDSKSVVYDPKADRWSPLADPFDSETLVRSGAVTVSTGDTLVVWGGSVGYGFGSRNPKAADNGVRLGARNAWQRMAGPRAPGQRAGSVSAWTGKEVLVWGGWKNGKVAKGGGAYDSAADTWRKMPARETVARREDALWTGTELWLWDSDSTAPRKGHAYVAAEDRWRDLAVLPETRRFERSMTRCGDGVILVCREGHLGSDLDGCVVWRYEPRADLWEPSAPPPRAARSPAGKPQLVDCDGRIVMGFGEALFEYLPAKDAWAELPAAELGHDPHLLWLEGELYGFSRTATRALTLPESVTAVAAEAAPTVLGRVHKKELPKGAPVVAIAITNEGKVTISDEDDGIRRAQRGDQRVVAEKNKLSLFVGKKLAKSVAITGETSHLAIWGDTITRVVLGPEKKKGSRTEPRDTLEIRDASTLTLRQELTPPYALGTTSAVPVETGVYASGRGSYRTELYPRGKKRAIEGKVREPLEHMTISADGHWLLGCTWEGVALYDLRDGHREFFYRIRECSAVALSPDGTKLAFGTQDGVARAVDLATLEITAYPPKEKPFIVQPGASTIVARVASDAEPATTPELALFVNRPKLAEPEGRGDSWHRWRILEDNGQSRFIELPDAVKELIPLPNGSLAVRDDHELTILSADGLERKTFAGHGGGLQALAPSADGKTVTVWDRQGLVRRWTIG